MSFCDTFDDLHTACRTCSGCATKEGQESWAVACLRQPECISRAFLFDAQPDCYKRNRRYNDVKALTMIDVACETIALLMRQNDRMSAQRLTRPCRNTPASFDHTGWYALPQTSTECFVKQVDLVQQIR